MRKETPGNDKFELMNQARGIAEGSFLGSPASWGDQMPVEERIEPVLSAYDGIFKSSYKFPPYNPDQVIGQKGYDFMENMLKMSACWATFNLKRYSVLKDGWTVEPAVVSEQDPNHEEAKHYSDALRYCLNNIVDEEVDYPQDFATVFFDQMMSAWLGYRIHSIQYRSLQNTSIDGLDGKYGFTGFWSKTNKQMGFDVDPNTLSPKRFVSYTPNGGFNSNVHPEKVWCYTHAQSANDPTGQADARRVYKNWFALDVLQKLWAIAIERWGAPVFVAQYPAGQDSELQKALSAMNEIRQGQSPIIPDNIKYELVTCPQGVFEAFEAGADWHVRQISLAVNSNNLSTGEGKHGATSAGAEVHQDTGDAVADYLSERMCRGFEMQVIRRWMRYNWGVKSLFLAPTIKLRTAGMDSAMISAMSAMFTGLVNLGNMPPTSKLIREGLRLAPIDADEQKQIDTAMKVQQEAQQQVADAKNSGPGGGQLPNGGGNAPFSDHDNETWLRRVATAILAQKEIAAREPYKPATFGKEPATKGYKYSSAQVNMPPELASRVRAWSRKFIPENALAEDGRELTPYITVKYGLVNPTPEDVATALRTSLAGKPDKFSTHNNGPAKPISAVLGAIERFDTNPDFDVLYVAVHSPDLETANQAISDACDHVDTHAEYTPHMTVAYVKKGTCPDLVGSEPFVGERAAFDTVQLSNPDKTMTSIKFGGQVPVNFTKLSVEMSRDISHEPRDQSGEWTGEGTDRTFTSSREAEEFEETNTAPLTSLERVVVQDYTGSSVPYGILHGLTSSKNLRYNEWGGTLEGAIANSKFLDATIDNHRIRKNITVFRGLYLSSTDRDRIVPGAIITSPSFQSTSLLKEVADNYSYPDGATLEINVPAGSKALVIGKHSVFEEQHEVILPRDAKFLVKSVSMTHIRLHVVVDLLDTADMSRDISREPRDYKGEWTSGGSHSTITQDDIDNHAGLSQRERTPVPEQVPTPSARSERAKQSATRIDSQHQRYSEEHNEPILAKMIGGTEFADNEPVDVAVIRDGIVQHGIEMKTILTNKAGQITMHASALQRKAKWVADNHAPFHTVVFDDSKVFNANGQGEHDDSQRVMYYKRGAGSFRIASMHKVADAEELKTLLVTPDRKLPPAAKPLASYQPPKPRRKPSAPVVPTAPPPDPSDPLGFSLFNPSTWTWFTKTSIQGEQRDAKGRWVKGTGTSLMTGIPAGTVTYPELYTGTGDHLDSGRYLEHLAKLSGKDKIGERASLHHYSSRGDAKMNKFLREGSDPYGEYKDEDLDEVTRIRDIDGVMQRSKLPDTVIVYRGLIDTGTHSHLEPGATFTDRGCQSTTLHRWIADGFIDGGEDGATMIKITIPKGTRAVAMTKSRSQNDHEEERELLLDRSTTLRVDKVITDRIAVPIYGLEERDEGDYLPLRIVHATVVSQDKGADFAAHDVSGESRDSRGKWTSGKAGHGSPIDADFENHFKALNGPERHFVQMYTVIYSINDILRAGEGHRLYKDYLRQREAIDSAMAKSTLSADVTLYRAVNTFPDSDKVLVPGATFEDKAYQSTSTNLDSAAFMADHYILRIHAKKGSHALAIGENSAVPDQSEVLLPRNSKLKVLNVSDCIVEVPWSGQRKTKFIDAELL